MGRRLKQHLPDVGALGHQLQAVGTERQHADPCPHRLLLSWQLLGQGEGAEDGPIEQAMAQQLQPVLRAAEAGRHVLHASQAQ